MKDLHAEALPKPTLLGAEPQLFVRNIKASCEFYNQKLGFEVALTYSQPVFYGQVVRDAASLNLRHLNEPAVRPEFQAREQLLPASITVDNVELLFLEFQAAGVTLH